MTNYFLIFGRRRSRWLLILITFSLTIAACVPIPLPPAPTPFSGRPTETPVVVVTVTASRSTQTPTATSVSVVPTGVISATSDNISSTVTPSLSSLGGRLVFVYADNLYAVDANCGWRANACIRERTRLTNVPKEFSIDLFDLTASPDGRKIAFVYRKQNMARDGITPKAGDIYALDIAECMAVEGGCAPERFTRLTTDPGDDYAPAWSPRGDKILFMHYPHEAGSADQFGLYEMKPDGSQPQLVISEMRLRGLGQYPVSWSPDGARLAMSAYNDSRLLAIFILRLKDLQLQQITSQPSMVGELDFIRPSWSPRGDKIIFEGVSFLMLSLI